MQQDICILQRAVEEGWNLQGVKIIYKRHHITVLNSDGTLHSCLCTHRVSPLSLEPYYNNSTVYWPCDPLFLHFPGLPSVLWELISEYYFVPDQSVTEYTKS